MNGARALLNTLRANDVAVCFTNPGTSEMHLVAALDDEATTRAILCLFEGVATGAADGYARVARTPAATLLHLGPGMANGWANLHNARRARVPLVNIVGDHATYHAALDAPLQSNVKLLADALEGWYRRSASPDELSGDVTDAVAAAYGPPGRVATLVVPADVSWSEVKHVPATPRRVERPAPHAIDEANVQTTIKALRAKKTTLFLGGSALTKDQLGLAHRVAAATSSRVLMETFPAMMDRGASVASPERLLYLSEFALAQLNGTEALILLGAKAPVSFFADPKIPSRLTPKDCEVIDLAPPGSDTGRALTSLVESINAPLASIERGAVPPEPHGALTAQSFASAVGATMPEGVIVADESNTSGVALFDATRFAPEHQWMTLTGGSIGYGLPVALGAAVASRRRVLALESDGSMMYTLQALWTMAREGVDVTVVGLSNKSYAILKMERARVGPVKDGAASERLLGLDDPSLELAQLARAQGVPSVRVESADELVIALKRSYATPGPMFIEAVLSRVS